MTVNRTAAIAFMVSGVTVSCCATRTSLPVYAPGSIDGLDEYVRLLTARPRGPSQLFLRVNHTDQLVHVLALEYGFQFSVDFCPEDRDGQFSSVKAIVAHHNVEKLSHFVSEKRCGAGVTFRFDGSSTKASGLLAEILTDGIEARSIEYDYEY
jgi:hypothetical protein